MSEYYDLKKRKIIDLEKESCNFENWENNHNEFSCCRHSHGFYIFLNPNEINSLDEYHKNDPYSVFENLTSDFHQRRLNCTLELIMKSKSSKKLLDLGCGQGHFTNKIKEKFSDYHVFGLDYSISAIEYASTKYKNIDFVVANAYTPPYLDEYFNIIILNNIWEHVPDPLHLLKSVNRILKPNGQLIISTPSRYRYINLIKVFQGKEISFLSKNHVTEYTVGQIKEQLKYGGYNVNRVYSQAIRERKLTHRIIKFLISTILKVFKSHHILEATVFYSANKMPST